MKFSLMKVSNFPDLRYIQMYIHECTLRTILPYHQEYIIIYCIAGKFGGSRYDRQIKIRQYFRIECMRVYSMTIPYRTAKFKSANVFISAALDHTAKFKDRQYFRLYGILQLIRSSYFFDKSFKYEQVNK